MAHELESTNGVTFYADSRNDAWHGLGQQVGHLMTAEEVLAEAHLGGWDVRKKPTWTCDDDGNVIQIEDRFATVRTNPLNGATEYLGTVGRIHTPIQNEETVEFLDALVDESGAHFETAGSLREGRGTFVTMLLPNTMELTLPDGTVDKTELYLAAVNHHDGYGSFQVHVTPVRIVCANTQAAAIARAKSSWAVRHTANATKAIEEARQSLKVAFKFSDAFNEEMFKLLDAQVEEDRARALLATVFDVDTAKTERAKKSRTAHVDAVIAGLDLPTIGSAKGTMYGLYNAVTEYVDHRIPLKEQTGIVSLSPEKALIGGYADIKTRAFSQLVAAI